MSEKTPLLVGALMVALVVYLMIIGSLPDYVDATQKLILYLVGLIVTAVLVVGVTR